MNKYTVALVALTTGFVAGNLASEKDIFSITNQDKMTVLPTLPNGETVTTLGSLANESSTTLATITGGYFDTLGIDCSDNTTKISVDERARIGATLSLLKAIDVNIAGANSRSLPTESVYPFVKKIVAASGHPELSSNEELDNIPAGEYTVPTECINNETGLFIPKL